MEVPSRSDESCISFCNVLQIDDEIVYQLRRSSHEIVDHNCDLICGLGFHSSILGRAILPTGTNSHSAQCFSDLASLHPMKYTDTDMATKAV